MRLESDPTIVYGLVGGKGTLGHSISRSELNQPTPYNTYLIEGLPPGPIANPGKAAMEAVANPSRTRTCILSPTAPGGHAFADTLEQHQKNVQRWRQIEKDAKDRLAPDAAPTAPCRPRRGQQGAWRARADRSEGVRRVGGARRSKPPPTAAELTKRLAKIGVDRQTREALLGPSGVLSARRQFGRDKSLADIGAVVQGVNDEPAIVANLPGDNDDARRRPRARLQTYPMSAAALADQQSRAARYGVLEASAARWPAPKLVASADMRRAGRTHAGAARPRAFDASEGTPLDPLLNTTYDLNYPKVVPSFK